MQAAAQRGSRDEVLRAIRRFRAAIRRHYRRHGRHGLAWRRTRDPYRILVSEIMLQQTQVARVSRFYPRFIARFPDLRALARARTADVLRAWQGMGYNRRALALRKLAKAVSEQFRRRLPRERAALEALPGVGPATAGAVRAFAWNEPEVFVETNIRRVFIHSFFRGRHRVTDRAIERYIKRTLDRKNPREWYWALMDYGAWLGASGSARGPKSRPRWGTCANPNRQSAHYKRQAPFKGSGRELRGNILKALLAAKEISLAALARRTKKPYNKVKRAAEALAREGFAKRRGNRIALSS